MRSHLYMPRAVRLESGIRLSREPSYVRVGTLSFTSTTTTKRASFPISPADARLPSPFWRRSAHIDDSGTWVILCSAVGRVDFLCQSAFHFWQNLKCRFEARTTLRTNICTAGNPNSKAWKANSSDRLGPYDRVRVIMSRFCWE